MISRAVLLLMQGSRAIRLGIIARLILTNWGKLFSREKKPDWTVLLSFCRIFHCLDECISCSQGNIGGQNRDQKAYDRILPSAGLDPTYGEWRHLSGNNFGFWRCSHHYFETAMIASVEELRDEISRVDVCASSNSVKRLCVIRACLGTAENYFRGIEIIRCDENIKFASLYSGCGGLDLGFHQAGLRSVGALDFDSNALQNLSSNLGTKATCMDLSKFGDQHRDLIGDADILLAGPPCQGFSTAGLNDPEDHRNDHVWNVARIAGLIKPRVVIIENVRGLLNPKNSMHLDKTIAGLRQHGYSVSWDKYNLSDYGIPQSRVRVIILAVLSDDMFQLKIPCRERQCIRSALDGVQDIEDFTIRPLVAGSDELRIARKIAPGQKLSNVRSGLSSVHTWEIPDVFGKVTGLEAKLLETVVKLRRQNRRRDFGDADPVAKGEIEKFFGRKTEALIKSLITKKYLRRVETEVDLTNTFNGKFRRLQWDDVSPTVDTRFGQARYFLHPDEDRGFTVREAARLQSFPDTFSFSGSDSAKYRMIGNAVPPSFAKLVADTIVAKWASL